MSRTMSDEPLSESRYCVFHPTKPYLFVNHEHSGNGKMMVSAFHYNEDGELELINKVDCLPKDTSAKCGQGFCISKDGKYLYNLLNGYDAVAVYKVGEDGLLTQTEYTAFLQGGTYIIFFDPWKQ